jgi:hypothetical protein
MARRRAPPIPVLGGRTAPIHYEWVHIPVWVTTYRTRKGKRRRKRVLEVKIHSIRKPTSTKVLKTQGGLKTFYAIHCVKQTRGFIVAKDTKRKKKDEDELETEIEGLEELSDVDELEADAEIETDDTPDDEAPRRKKRDKGARGRRQSRAAAEGKIGTAELADKCGVDARTLRMVLRKFRGQHGIEIDAETNRWQWPSLKDPAVKKIIDLIDRGEADRIKDDSLRRLKESQAEKKAKRKKDKEEKKGKKDKRGKKKSKDNDED